jgi:hypothetical protein
MIARKARKLSAIQVIANPLAFVVPGIVVPEAEAHPESRGRHEESRHTLWVGIQYIASLHVATSAASASPCLPQQITSKPEHCQRQAGAQ